MSKEQLAGLVEEIGDELEMAGYGAVTQLPTESLRDWHSRLTAILATLPEPGVVSDEAVEAALNGFFQEGPVTPRTEYAKESMRCALSDALPYLAPAGEVVTIQQAWEWAGGNPGIKATRTDLEQALRDLDAVCDAADTQPAPPAQGFDAEVAEALEFLLTRIGSWTSARWDQHLRYEFGDGRAEPMIRALAAAAKGVGRQNEDGADEDREPCPGCFVRDCNGECMENL